MLTILFLVLVPSPQPKPPALLGVWVVEWGTIKPYFADFRADGEYFSDEPWGDGRWHIDEQGRYVFSDRTGLWLIRIDDPKAKTGVGQKIYPDGTLASPTPVKIRARPIE